MSSSFFILAIAPATFRAFSTNGMHSPEKLKVLVRVVYPSSINGPSPTEA